MCLPPLELWETPGRVPLTGVSALGLKRSWASLVLEQEWAIERTVTFHVAASVTGDRAGIS